MSAPNAMARAKPEIEGDTIQVGEGVFGGAEYYGGVGVLFPFEIISWQSGTLR